VAALVRMAWSAKTGVTMKIEARSEEEGVAEAVVGRVSYAGFMNNGCVISSYNPFFFVCLCVFTPLLFATPKVPRSSQVCGCACRVQRWARHKTCVKIFFWQSEHVEKERELCM
jgi:hypothetical protein